MFAFLHSGVLWPSGLPTPFPDVRGQLYCGGSCALQLHRQADSGGKCHPRVWTGRTLDWLPAPLFRYGAWHGERGPIEHLTDGRWTSSQGANVTDGRKVDLLNPHLIPHKQRAQVSEVPTGLQTSFISIVSCGQACTAERLQSCSSNLQVPDDPVSQT